MDFTATTELTVRVGNMKHINWSILQYRNIRNRIVAGAATSNWSNSTVKWRANTF